MSSFLDHYRDVRESEKEERETLERYNNALDAYYNDWKNYRIPKGVEVKNAPTKTTLSESIRRLGIAEGKLNKDSSQKDIAEYGLGILNDLNTDSEITFEDYVKKQGNEEQRNAWDSLKEAYEKYPKINKAKPANNFLEAIGNGIYEGAQGVGNFVSGIFNSPYYTRAALNKGKWEETLNNMQKDYENYSKEVSTNKYAFLDNPDKYIKAAEAEAAAAKTEEDKAGANKSTSKKDAEKTTDDTVTFTLPRANDPNYRGFGQKIVDLGLATDKGLWGSDGDVQFYTKQLYDQGALDANGNLKIGVPIKLKKRKVNK